MSKKQGFEIDIISSKKSSNNRTSVSQVKGDINQYFDTVNKIQNKFEKQADKVVTERQKASKMVSMANKRLRRLEENNLQMTPAYQGFLANGGQYFSVRGKTPSEVQQEVKRMKGFIDAGTSTVRGTNAYLKGMAKDTGIKYKNLKDLYQKAPKFFELASKTEQYLRTVEDMASAIDYNKIWESINVYVKENKIDLANSENDIDDMIKNISDALKLYDERMSVKGEVFRLKK